MHEVLNESRGVLGCRLLRRVTVGDRKSQVVLSPFITHGFGFQPDSVVEIGDRGYP